MNFLIHENLPKLSQYLEGYGTLQTFSGRTPPSELLANTHALLIRSVTQVNARLLEQAPNLSFVGTGTIGTEHVDTQTLAERNIGFASAPGANAISVGEYVLAATLELASKAQVSLDGKRALIIGAGHTGTQAGLRLAALGMQVEYIDPAPVLPTDNKTMVGWEALATADVVSLHVPLIHAGEHATYHLFNEKNLAQLKPGAIFINASRGPVIQELALIKRLRTGPKLYCALDVWEQEPQVSRELVGLVNIATPHIAGHSQEGKIRGSYLLYKALAAYFCWPHANKSEEIYMPERGIREFSSLSQDTQRIPQSTITEWVRSSYDIMADDKAFRAQGLSPEGFDGLRKKYQHRRELSATCVKVWKQHEKQCQQLGFLVVPLINSQ
ncbi:4-phosphoerythronate dehydrogenase [Aliidiomarina taiwanensis]|uniref:Erythronate-4-phosphate dehydrogenase n=1 Tax=Aliidiomarina taiwanensis TaxID=946228 RepID=A0A432X8U4_9GAMM|nr:4-phosphoerythronate dehydrogenase [Aliidiomarina taiwanensis]RUO43808.1 4-phosphoerythronate dehydrogenase [Aliidiomarina taiwanensis]